MRSGLYVATALASCVALASAANAQQQFVLKGFGGVSISPEAEGDATLNYSGSSYEGSLEFDLDSGWIIGGAAGVNVSDFTFEGEVAYRSAGTNGLELSFLGYTVPVDVDDADDFTVTSIMANGWYNVPFSPQWVGYGGGGIGAAKAEIGDLEGDFTFAWQLGVGIRYLMSEKTSVGVGYRYFQVTDALEEAIDLGGGDSASFATDFTDSALIAEITTTF